MAVNNGSGNRALTVSMLHFAPELITATIYEQIDKLGIPQIILIAKQATDNEMITPSCSMHSVGDNADIGVAAYSLPTTYAKINYIL